MHEMGLVEEINFQARQIERLTAERDDLKDRLASALDALGRTSAHLGAEVERMRKLLDSSRKAMAVSQRFHPGGTDWSDMIAAIDTAFQQLIPQKE